MRATYESVAAAVQLAAFDPAAWPEATAQVAAFCGAHVGNIIASDQKHRLTLNALSNVTPDFIAELGERVGDPDANPRVRAALNRPLLVPYTDDQILSQGQRERYDLYETFDRGDTGFASSVVIYRQPDFLAGVSVGSPHHGRDGHSHRHERLTRCAVLIRDALRVQVALEHRGLEALASGLEALNVAAFLCKEDGSVLRATQEGEPLLEAGDRLVLRAGRLAAVASSHEPGLQGAIASAAWDRSRACRTLILTDAEGEGALTVDVTRLPSDPYSLGFSASVLVTARAIAGRTSTGAQAARRAYGLTAAETEVAVALARGDAPEEIAMDRGVSVETIRAQIRSVYAKTGVTRASKLVRLVEGLS